MITSSSDGISRDLLSEVNDYSNLFSKFAIYFLIQVYDFNTIWRSSSFITPKQAKELISLTVDTCPNISPYHCGYKKYESFNITSS